MKYKEFKAEVLAHAVGQAKLLAQASYLEDIKIAGTAPQECCDHSCRSYRNRRVSDYLIERVFRF